MKLLEVHHVHLVGIKGVALTPFALCLDDLGIRVTGSDIAEDFVTKESLAQRKFHIYSGFAAEHITDDIDVVVYTGAHQGKQNVEVAQAIELGIPVMSHAEALGELVRGKKLISVCGTGGKSTTSAMVAWILDQAGLHPSFAVGVGNIPNLGIPGRFVKDSQWFVAEADEYAVDPLQDKRPRFVFQKPQIIVCTNLKYDHPDIYASFKETKKVFVSFFNTLPDNGTLILNGDDKDLTSLLPKLTTKATVIQIHRKESDTLPELAVPGVFNRMNAQMALRAAELCGVASSDARQSLIRFQGTMRRFEYKGMVNKAECYDDYAHTPDEIRATLKALRDWYPTSDIIAVFQPHTYSRTKALFDGFVSAFSDADTVLITDIFASAREQNDESVSAELLVSKMQEVKRNKSIEFIPSLKKVTQRIRALANDNTVIMTLGAGDIYTVWDNVQEG